MSKNSCKSVLLVFGVILIAFLATSSVWGQENSEQDAWDAVLRSYGFIRIDALPQGVEPAPIRSLDDVRSMVDTLNAQRLTREALSDEVLSGELTGDVVLRDTYQEVQEDKVCSTPVGASSFNGYARVTIGIWNGVYRAYQRINSIWWSHTGVTTGITITNVNQNYYLATQPPSSSMWMRNNFTINWYTVTPWGWVYLYSQDSYVHCQKPA